MTAGAPKHAAAPPPAPEPDRSSSRHLAEGVAGASQRTTAMVLGFVTLLGLWMAAVYLPVPYVIYEPGVVVDVLAESDGEEIIQVTGRQTYRDDGQLDMTTIYVTPAEGRVNLFEVMQAWVSSEDDVYPYDTVYRADETREDSDRESAVQMVSSQDAAIAAALTRLGVDFTEVVEVLNVESGFPADGKLEVRDVIVKVGDTTITDATDVVDAVRGAPKGEPIAFEIRRDGKSKTVKITPKQEKSGPRVGIVPGEGFDFPFDVEVNIDPKIGGPSAGLMFSLAIYDTLTPGSMTDGKTVAGTGTIQSTGEVGPIGGIQQKIVAARDAGAALFMVPPDNCDDALGAPQGDMRLVRADTMDSAVDAIESWVDDPSTDLPKCVATEKTADAGDAS